jgi:hypothetical protein
MDILTSVRLNGILLFHYELGHPWRLALPQFPDAVFHSLWMGSATVAREKVRSLAALRRPEGYLKFL